MAVPVFYASVALFDTRQQLLPAPVPPSPSLYPSPLPRIEMGYHVLQFEEPFRFALWITAAALSAIDQLWWQPFGGPD